MKLVIAYIRPERLNQVKRKLFKNNIRKLSVTNSLGHGEQEGFTESYRGVEMEVDLLKRVRLEIGVNDDFVEPTVKAIMDGAKTGDVGDGKIFVIQLEQTYRIRTGDKGMIAIG